MIINLFSGHPKGLFVCFATELWERFSYYGMRALLIFYLTEHFLYTDDESYAIYGAYTGLAWMLPVIGGIVADRWLGSRKAVTVGAILLSLGHFGMAIEGPPAQPIPGTSIVEQHGLYLNAFYLSLALIVTGVGFLKTNITTVVGQLYSLDDPRRDSAFTIFYMGINIGATISPIICGWLGQTYGWRYGFGIAGVGMLAGLIIFLRGQVHLLGKADPPDPARLRESVLPGISREVLIYLGAVLLVLIAWQLIEHHQIVGAMLGGFGAVLGAVIIYYSIRHCSPVERDRLLVVAILIVFATVFWSLYEQQGSSLNLYADRMVKLNVPGMRIEASQLQSLAPLFLVIAAPFFSALWLRLGKQKRDPVLPVKFSIGLVLIGASFFLPWVGAVVAGPGERAGLIWLTLTFLFMALGELCLSPIALNMVTRLCPQRVVGMMMGAYFVSLSAGNYFAGALAQFTSLKTVAGEVADPATAMNTYVSVFNAFALLGIAAGVLLYWLAPVLYRRMHETQ
ncbi:MAG: peptide MFS transporter [Gammaproteobacteria bacterium]|nr:peptide MFS transporter [Gammaproteobacteria bacterium]